MNPSTSPISQNHAHVSLTNQAQPKQSPFPLPPPKILRNKHTLQTLPIQYNTNTATTTPPAPPQAQTPTPHTHTPIPTQPLFHIEPVSSKKHPPNPPLTPSSFLLPTNSPPLPLSKINHHHHYPLPIHSPLPPTNQTTSPRCLFVCLFKTSLPYLLAPPEFSLKNPPLFFLPNII